MSEQSFSITNSVSFKEYLFENKRNRMTLWFAFAAIIVQFSIFKYFYPFASYIHGDSFDYLESAYQNLSINNYMVGYSMFIRAFSVFSTSDTALVFIQYLFLQTGSLFLLFTLFYFYKPGRIVKIILISFMVLNPLFLYLGNMISSDAFFAALSLTWITLLLWVIHRPSSKLIIWHAVVIFIAFTVRYNALIYLFIGSVAFMLSQLSLWKKVMGIALATVFICFFVISTGNEYKSLTGTWQYSPFAGWQFANNAMYAYRYVDSIERKPVPKRFEKLDKMIRVYFDSTRDTARYPAEKLMASTVYMWTRDMPLFKYRDDVVFKNDSTASEFKKWASMGPLFKSYGMYIIKQYPEYFARYFLWPNANKYYAPPVEFLENFNSGKDSVTDLTKAWFRYKTLKLTTRTRTLKITMLDFYPILSGMVNVIMLFGLLSFALLNGFKQNTPLRKGIILGGTVWLFNAGFTIFASSAALRFQSFPILLATVFSGLLIDWLATMTKTSNPQSLVKIEDSKKIGRDIPIEVSVR